MGALPKPPFILNGREIYIEKNTRFVADTQPWPCIFCGKPSEHVNHGGTHCWLGAFHGGKARQYSYCNEDPGCRETGIEQAYRTGLVWQCGCAGDYVENIGLHCASCGKVRDDRVLPLNEQET